MACLTGDNGHGKSAILDAMTWALWGYSSLGARRDDELIHLGQTEMEVEYTFQLQNNRYRVIRKRDRRKRGHSSLELQAWDDQEKRFRPLTEPTIAQTQDAINDLLRMDYVTFINSAFLLQGRADEFTIKRASERKQVLGTILGLDIYTEYEKAAKQAARDKKTRADQLLAAIAQIDRELARETEYKAALQAAEKELAQLQSQRTTLEAQYEQTRSELQNTETAQQQLTDLERHIAKAQEEKKELAAKIAAHQDRLDTFQDALTHEAEIEDGFTRYQKAVQENETLNADLGKLVSFNEKHSQLEQQIAAERHELDKTCHLAQEKANQLEQTAQALEREPEWDAVRVELAALQERLAEKEQTLHELQERNTDIARLDAQNRQAEQEAEQIKEKIALLQIPQEAKEQARCPLCGQPLGQDGCTKLVQDLNDELETKRDAYRLRKEHIKETRQRVVEIQERIDQIDRMLRGQAALQRKEAALAHTIQQARQAAQELVEAQAAWNEIETRLEQADFAHQTRQELAEVEQSLHALGYDAKAHRQVQERVKELRAFEAQIQTLREARSGVETVQLALSQLTQRDGEVDRTLAADQKQAAELKAIVQRLPDLRQQAREAKQTLEAAHDREQQANLELGAARTKVAYCADLHQQRKKREKEEQQLREEQSLYQELQQAFGKNGVQAMLIETAIPEIEEEANHLLRMMTGGRMQVRFETQRKTKKGDITETLDILILDESRARSYETYSGGERYRINFAVRVALSRLLARRAGAELEMLVIDEGFGTQDSQGRDGLIDAINAVSEDFGCILVITHIEELKDAFTVRIDVTKTSEGSQIAIM